MRQLRFVRATDDGQLLVLETTDDAEQFSVHVDGEIRDAVRSDLPRLPAPPPAAPAPVRVEPEIAPREIQVRVRGGESPEALAESIGLSLDRVLRFAAPVMDERRRIADEARRARARRTGQNAEGPLVLFGETVDTRFTAHGIVAADVTWDAHRRDDGEWVIVATWLGGEGSHSCEWLFHRGSRTVTPADETAADLLSDRPVRPLLPAEPERPNLTVAPPLTPGVVAFPPMPDAHTGPVPVVEEVFDQDAPPEGPRDLPPLLPTARLVDFDAPPLPLGIADPYARPEQAFAPVPVRGSHRRDESDDDRAARARVPSWDDILLGIRRKHD